jgi:hypothetical protein
LEHLKTKYCYIAQEKNKAKSQVNVTIVLTKNYDDQQKPAKKQSQFIGQNPYF